MLPRGWGSQTPSPGWKDHPAGNPNPVSPANLLTKQANSHGSYLHTFAKHRFQQDLGWKETRQQWFKSYLHLTDCVWKGCRVLLGLQLSRKPRAAAVQRQPPMPAHLQQSSSQSKRISTGKMMPEHPEPVGLLRARRLFSLHADTYVSAFASRLQRTGRVTRSRLCPGSSHSVDVLSTSTDALPLLTVTKGGVSSRPLSCDTSLQGTTLPGSILVRPQMLSSGPTLQSSRFPQEQRRASPKNSSPAADTAFEPSSSAQRDDTAPCRARGAESRAHPAFLLTGEEGLARNIVADPRKKGRSHLGKMNRGGEAPEAWHER